MTERFDCNVVGVDYSLANIQAADRLAQARGLRGRAVFQFADAERLPFPDFSFDVIICECALCIFPEKQAAAREFSRVLRPGGRLGISDLTRTGILDEELSGLTSWITCVADAQPLSGYAALITGAGLSVSIIEDHTDHLTEFVAQIRNRLLAAEVMAKLRKLVLPTINFEAAKYMVVHTLNAINSGKLGYAIVAASKAT